MSTDAETHMNDSRLLGTWRSDARKTDREIAARRDIPASTKARLRPLFGKLVLRYTKTRCYATLGGETEASRYVVVAKDSSSVAVVYVDPVDGTEAISHIHFEGRHYWISLGRIREYFRRIA
jgi:hypothetical protein